MPSSKGLNNFPYYFHDKYGWPQITKFGRFKLPLRYSLGDNQGKNILKIQILAKK